MDYKYETLISRAIQNVSDHHMTLKINRFQCGYEMNISTNWWHSFQTNTLLLFLLLAIALTDYMLQIYNIYHFVVLFIVFAILFNHLTSVLKSENLLIVKNVGYQIEECYLFGKKRTFIPWNSVESVFINEVITKQKVLFILTIKTWIGKDRSSKLFPLFQITKPRLKDTKDMYRVLKSL